LFDAATQLGPHARNAATAIKRSLSKSPRNPGMVPRANMQGAAPLRFQTYNPYTEFDVAANIWRALSLKQRHSYFVSWGWISNWIKSLPTDTDIQLIAGFAENEPVLAFFIGRSKRNRHRFIPTNTISLNSTANRYYDEITIEYNSMLSDPSVPIDKEFLFDFLSSITWDEFRLPGVSAEFISGFNMIDISHRGPYVVVDEVVNSFFVDLQKIRDAGMDYLRLLSANKRSQIRKSIKQYEIEGKIQIREAESAEEASTMFDELAVLHQQEWEGRGKPGSFSNDYFRQFHKTLIQNRHCENEIQLLHIFNDRKTIGYLYNFVYAGNVLYYQSGFNYSNNNAYRPGLVSHYFAITHNAKKNLSTYDFLAGNSAYKNSLSTNSASMYWVRFVKSRWRLYFEKSLAQLRKWADQKDKPAAR
jgi:CelD/BcsL family acetyltransferase involved in cellulose biosynthesis